MASIASNICYILSILLFLSPSCHGFHLPGTYPHKYSVGEALSVKVNSLTSIDAELPYGYYSLPFCRPQDGIKDVAQNLGELLMGDRIENSPYRFKMLANESDLFLCHSGLLSTDDFNLPVKTNQLPHEIPPQKYPSWLFVLAAGTLPFGTLFIELFFITSSLWMGRAYCIFGLLFIVLILLLVVCAEVSVVLTYMRLRVEDWRWWWKAFFASGSVAIYIFLYLVNYLVFDLKSLSGPVSAALYLGYSLIMVLAIMLATGTVGFISSFWFVHYLYSSVKQD